MAVPMAAVVATTIVVAVVVLGAAMAEGEPSSSGAIFSGAGRNSRSLQQSQAHLASYAWNSLSVVSSFLPLTGHAARLPARCQCVAGDQPRVTLRPQSPREEVLQFAASRIQH